MTILVTGASGFIGHRLALNLLSSGQDLVLIDNFSRRGAELNEQKIKTAGGTVRRVDVSDVEAVFRLLREIKSLETVFHLAAQVAVTTSYQTPVDDFMVNALGTFNIVEGVRLFHPQAHIVYASTNKVFGSHNFSAPIRNSEVANPYSPYGVSKFVGDLYLREYRRKEFQISSTVLRQSCIYGPGQMGVEDQGWVAWFLLANMGNRKVTVFGDGNQVRDLLHVDDLINLYLNLHQSRINGDFVVGGGEHNSETVKSILHKIEELTKMPFISVGEESARPGDQPYFVADNGELELKTGWAPRIGVDEGLASLKEWITEEKTNLIEAGLY